MTSAAWLVTATKMSVMMLRRIERSALDVVNGGEAALVWHRPRSGRSTSDAIRFTRNLCSGSRADCVVGAGDTPAATEESTIIGGKDAFPKRPTFPIFTCTGEKFTDISERCPYLMACPLVKLPAPVCRN